MEDNFNKHLGNKLSLDILAPRAGLEPATN